MQNKNHYVAIMAGGIGSRFWPMSRTALPKQFLDVLNTGKTLVQWTYERYAKFIPAENIFIVTSEEYVDIVKTQLPMLPIDNILAEPSKKNTAPCIAYISFKLAQINPDAKCIVAPSDHLILEEERFQAIVLQALDFVDNIKALATLGIKPTHPNTGYGYIQYEGLEVTKDVYKVKTFTEKPDVEIAKSFIESGDFLWNAGIFAWKISSILTATDFAQSPRSLIDRQDFQHQVRRCH
jgi:mannose-1-phosphate guanylyltransferase